MSTPHEENFRSTGLFASGALAILAGGNAWRGHLRGALILLAVGAGIALASMISVRFAKRFHHHWTAGARTLAFINTCLLLAVVYLGGFVLYRIWGRIRKRDPLGRRRQGQASYWVTRVRTRQQRWQFERLY